MKISKAFRTIACCLAISLSLGSLAGCNSSSDSDSSTTKAANDNEDRGSGSVAASTGSGESKVVVGLAFDPQNIGPFQGMSAGRIGILYTTYEFLVTTEGGEMKGVMMKDYEKIDDLTYNCEIYDYIYDSEGNHITADDVVFSYETGAASGNLPKLGSIDSVIKIDDYTVQFKFNSLAIGDLGALWMECPIVSQAAYEASSDQMATQPVTTSAYHCTEFVSGSKMVFTNTGSYWQTDESLINDTSKSNVEVIEFDIITDSSQLTNALKTNTIDVTNWLSDVDAPDFMNLDGYSISEIPDNTTYLLYFNGVKGSVFSDNLELRQAIAYAIDSSQLVDGALSGNGNVAKTFGNANYSDYQDSWDSEDYYDYDLNEAKELMSASGIQGIELTLMIESGDVTTKIATIIQAQLAQIGITVKIATYDSQLYNDYKYNSDEWDILLDQLGSTSYLVNVWKLGWDRTGYTHGGAMNFVVDDQLQQLIEAAADVDGHGDKTMDDFHQYLKEQCYGIGLIQQNNNITHTNKITKIVVDARGQVTPGACSYSFD